MLTAATWTYTAAGGPNPFIVPARGGFIATAVNTETGATIVGLGRRATRFARPLKLEARGVAIFAQPSPGTLPERAWAVGYSTTAGVAPRLIAIARDGEVVLDVARPELSWRDGRQIGVTETPTGPVLHVDDRHLLLDHAGDVVAEVRRASADTAYVIEGDRLYAHDGAALLVVDVPTGRTRARIPLEGRVSALRPSASGARLAVRAERVLLVLDLEDPGNTPRVCAMLGGLHPTPSAADANLRAGSASPSVLECVDDDGAPRWTLMAGGASGLAGVGFFTGGELLAVAAHASGDRVLVARDGEVLFERPRAGTPSVAGALARVGDRVALVLAPGAAPSGLVEFGSSIEVLAMRGGGAVAYERPSGPGAGNRMLLVDAAGARVAETTEGAAGARWASASEGLIAVPRANAARVDLFDTGAPA